MHIQRTKLAPIALAATALIFGVACDREPPAIKILPQDDPRMQIQAQDIARSLDLEIWKFDLSDASPIYSIQAVVMDEHGSIVQRSSSKLSSTAPMFTDDEFDDPYIAVTIDHREANRGLITAEGLRQEFDPSPLQQTGRKFINQYPKQRGKYIYLMWTLGLNEPFEWNRETMNPADLKTTRLALEITTEPRRQ